MTQSPVAVIGCGRMGRLHARVYSQLPRARLVGVYDPRAEAAEATAREFNTRAFASIESLIGQVCAVTIATPTAFHLASAEPFLRAGVSCLIEKPLARDEAEGQRLIELAQANGATLQVGHIERYNPAVRAVAALGLRPRYIETIRVSPLPYRSLDVGVVLDIMIHDIDIVLSLVGSRVSKVDATGVSVLGGVEDVCNARLIFENGVVASLTASRLALKTERRLRLFAADAFVSVDYAAKTGHIARAAENLPALRQLAARVRGGEVIDPNAVKFADLVKLEPLATQNIDQLQAQATAFLDAVENRTRPVVSGEDGLEALRVAQRIVAAIEPGMHV